MDAQESNLPPTLGSTVIQITAMIASINENISCLKVLEDKQH